MKALKKIILSILVLTLYCGSINAQDQNEPANDVTTPLHLLQPDYPTPYGEPSIESIKIVLDKVYNYLDQVTPAKVVDKNGEEITDFSKLNEETALQLPLFV